MIMRRLEQGRYLEEACGSRSSLMMVAKAKGKGGGRVSENQKGSHGNDAHALGVTEEEDKTKTETKAMRDGVARHQSSGWHDFSVPSSFIP